MDTTGPAADPGTGRAAERETQAAREQAADERQFRADEREQLTDQREREAGDREAGADAREREAGERRQELSATVEDVETRTLAAIE